MKNTPINGGAPGQSDLGALELATWFLGGMRHLMPGVPDRVLKACIMTLMKEHGAAGPEELDEFMASLPMLFRRVGYEEWPPLCIIEVLARLVAQGWRPSTIVH